MTIYNSGIKGIDNKYRGAGDIAYINYFESIDASTGKIYGDSNANYYYVKYTTDSKYIFFSCMDTASECDEGERIHNFGFTVIDGNENVILHNPHGEAFGLPKHTILFELEPKL